MSELWLEFERAAVTGPDFLDEATIQEDGWIG